MNGVEHANFFETRATEYSKAATRGNWNEVWENFDRRVKAKAEALRRHGLSAILCIGETLEERDAGQAVPVVTAMLGASLPEGAAASWLSIAYEPVWAIGTGRTPTVDDVAAMHGAIRARLRDLIPPG